MIISSLRCLVEWSVCGREANKFTEGEALESLCFCLLNILISSTLTLGRLYVYSESCEGAVDFIESGRPWNLAGSYVRMWVDVSLHITFRLCLVNSNSDTEVALIIEGCSS